MHLEILDKNRQKLLNELSSLQSLKNFYMAGGTALSLLLGLRVSIDFDFFTSSKFNPATLFVELKEKFSKRVIFKQSEENLSYLNVEIDGVEISFLQYLYPLICETITSEELGSIKLASVDDILCMKVIAINQRGLKKDYFDFAITYKTLGYSPEIICKILLQKFNEIGVLTMLIFSVTFFEDAEKSTLPKLFVNYTWEDVKDICLTFGKELKKYLVRSKLN